jgi:uncharacterized protein YeaO (DUF488 family)
MRHQSTTPRTAAAPRPPRTVQVRHPLVPAQPEDGVRVLVERRWPPGLQREQAGADLWLREIAPTATLLRWCNADPQRWADFPRLYGRELDGHADLVRMLARLHAERGLTLLTCARGGAGAAAEVLRERIEQWREDADAAR